MAEILDHELGRIIIRKYNQARSIKARRAPNGDLRVSAPAHTPNFIIKHFINQNRKALLKLLEESAPEISYYDGMIVGKSHSLIVLNANELTVNIKNNIIAVNLPSSLTLTDQNVINILRPAVIKALKKEAKAHLPKRLDYIAKRHGFTYKTVKFSHASSKWGSCKNDGTINLNIALMKLPFELIDYVIAHELAHTIEMNHSPQFWRVVAGIDPNYKHHRKMIKNESPNI